MLIFLGFSEDRKVMSQAQDQVIRDIIKMTLYILSIMVNLSLLFILWLDPIKRFRNPPSYTIANLALADIIAAVGGLGSCLAIFFSSSNITMHKVFGSVTTAGLQSSFLVILTLAFDRYLAMNYPYRYRRIFGEKYWNIILNLIEWILACTISPVVYFVNLGYDNFNLVLYHLYVIDLAVLALVTSILYPLNYWSFLKAKNRIERSESCRQKVLEDLRLGRQLNQTWMIVASFLFLSMVPYVYTLVISVKKCISCLLNPSFIKFWSHYQVVFPAILLANPVIYAWRLPLYRKAFRALWSSKLPSQRIARPKKLSKQLTDLVSVSSKSKETASTITPTMV